MFEFEQAPIRLNIEKEWELTKGFRRGFIIEKVTLPLAQKVADALTAAEIGDYHIVVAEPRDQYLDHNNRPVGSSQLRVVRRGQQDFSIYDQLFGELIGLRQKMISEDKRHKTIGRTLSARMKDRIKDLTEKPHAKI